MSNVSRTFNKIGFKIQKHSPEILLGAGIVGTVTSAVLACKATTKVNFILEEAKEKVEIIHTCAENGEVKGYLENGEVGMIPYSEQDSKKDLSVVYAQTGLEFVKLYGPSVLLGAASLGCILASHNIIRKRNVALAAAYTVVENGFKDYRSRVVERFGKELDRELKYNIKEAEVEETVTNEDGTESVVKKTVKTVDKSYTNGYSRFFDECNPNWGKSAEYNHLFLVQIQNWANERLKAKGRLFLNEVYEMLGMDISKEGQIVGWVYDENNVYVNNYVDFGIYDVHNEDKRNFVNGRERSILLDFNVDGNILDLMQ